MLALCLGTHASAQHWRPIGRGTVAPGSVQTIYGDSVSDRLLIGGTFLRILNANDTALVVGQAAWNGNRWDSLATRIQSISGNSAQQTFWYTRYQEVLYACGDFTFTSVEGDPNRGLAKLDEQSMRWDAMECANPIMSGLLTLVPKEPEATLYATGFDEGLCGYPEACVFRYDGQAFHEWEPFEQIPEYNNNYVGYVFDLRGMTYMTGSYRDPLSNGFSSFMRFNGSAWEYVPGWGDQIGTIKDLTIHNDTLYVAGTFRQAAGAPGNGVAYFDGETWNDMGGGVNLIQGPQFTTGLCLQWFHDDLYVSGQFNEAGGIPINHIAKWNGHQWCSLPGDFYTPNTTAGWVSDMAVWRDSLYVCGAFTMIDGDTVRNVAQWIGGEATTNCSSVGMAEVVSSHSFTIAPNPATSSITLHGLPPTATTLVMHDVLGRTVLRLNALSPVLAIEALPSGTYTVKAFDAKDLPLGIARFVKH